MTRIRFCMVGVALFLLGASSPCACLSGVSGAGNLPVQKAEAAEKPLPRLLELGAHQCIPCKQMAPIIEALTQEFRGVLRVEFIDVWQAENQERAKAYGIQSIPTQIFLDAQGRELWRHVGFISREDILNKWTELGYVLKPREPGKP